MSQNLKDIINEIKMFGITEKEAEVYLAILSLGTTTVSNIMKKVNIHQPRLYSILNRLYEKGFIEIEDGKPKLYKAVDPVKKMEDIISELAKRKSSVERILRSMNMDTLCSTVPTVWTTKGSKNIIYNSKNIINSSNNDLILSVETERLKSLLEALTEAYNRNVNIFILLYPLDVKNTLLEKVKKIAAVSLVPAGYYSVISDSKRCIYSQRTAVAGDGTLGEYAFIINDPTLTDLISDDLASRWLRAIVSDDRQMFPGRFPKTYTNHVFALFEIERLLKGGKKPIVSVKGRYVKNGEVFNQSGPVTDVVIKLDKLIYYFTMKTDGREISVGGPDALLEDVAAREITVHLTP